MPTLRHCAATNRVTENRRRKPPMLASYLRWLIALQTLLGAVLGWAAHAAFGASWAWVAWLALLAPFTTAVVADSLTMLWSRPRQEPWRLWWRSLWGETRASILIFLLRQPWAGRSTLHPFGDGAGTRVPVLLVHGYVCNHRLWDKVALKLHRQGHAVMAVDLEPVFASIDDYAAPIEQAVQALRQRTGAAQVALVGHSMGGVAIRAWVRTHGLERVAKIITLGSPHAGTQVPQHLSTPNGRQMAWDSDWLRTLERSEAPALRQRMEIALSTHDNIVYPQREQVLSGVPVTVFQGIGHLQMCLDDGVIAWLGGRLAEAR